MHVLVDTDTGMIPALRVTGDTVGDSKIFVPLLEDTAGGDAVCVDRAASVLADGAYASRDIHRECSRRGIRPLIRLKASSVAKGRGKGDTWGRVVRDKLGSSPESRVGTLTDKQKRENRREWKERAGLT